MELAKATRELASGVQGRREYEKLLKAAEHELSTGTLSPQDRKVISDGACIIRQKLQSKNVHEHAAETNIGLGWGDLFCGIDCLQPHFPDDDSFTSHSHTSSDNSGKYRIRYHRTSGFIFGY